jgi:lysyl-tRNA synthetase class 2
MTLNWGLTRKRKFLEARAGIIQDIRRFFIEGGYLEIETPLLIPAPAPEAHIDAIPANKGFLQTSPEICMKRMLAAGFEKLFQLCRCWRNGERGIIHLPEFTMLEWYRTGTDYEGLIEDCESLLLGLSIVSARKNKIIFRGRTVDLSPPWDRITVRNAFSRYSDISMEDAIGRGIFDEIMSKDIEPRLGLGKPLFIIDYPAERGALARLKSSDETVAERFELYIGGLELANAFTELTDASEQRKRFMTELEFRRSGNKAVYPIPEKFLSELPAMPQAAGIAMGIDRLIMVLLDAETIDEVVAFTPEML